MAASPFNKEALNGKVALITGGGSGICFGIAKLFVAHGCNVAIMGRRENVLQDAANELRALGGGSVMAVQGDVREPASAAKAVGEVVRTFGGLDILVNGAAGNFLCSANDLSINAIRTVINIDLLGTFIMSKACFEPLKNSGAGVIINISAVVEDLIWYQSHAAAAKAGINQLTKNLAVEWGQYKIRVNGVAPGAIGDTEGMKRLSAGMQESALAVIPLGRLGKSEDIAKAAMYLAVHDWVTGQTLVVDGGTQVYRTPFVPQEVYEQLAASRRSGAKL